MAKGASSKNPPSDESDYDSDVSTSSSDTVEEDEFGEELTPALDAAILQTLGRIKRKEGVYGSENVLQEALQAAEKRAGSLGVKALKRVVEDKPYLLSDHHRAALLGKEVEEEDGEAAPLTNVQEQRKLREGAINAFKSLAQEDESDDSGHEEDGFVLKQRDRKNGELEEEDEEYRQFLLEMGGGEEEVRKILGMGDAPAWRVNEQVEDVTITLDKRKKKKKDSALNKVEKEEIQRESQQKKEKADDDFLMNYILNRGWIDRSDKHVPTYDEVVANVKADSDVEEEVERIQGSSTHPWGVLEEDDFDEKAEEFENAYNFRYEEPGSSNILTHPREIPSLVRRADDARKLKRQAREERKAAERAAAEDETRRLKGAKRREMEAHIHALKDELGEGLDYTALESLLEGDFDEDEWDRVMGEIIAQAADQEEDRPTWDDLGDAEYDEVDGEDGGYDAYAYNMDIFADEPVGEDEAPINMDADFDDEPLQKKSKKDKKNKKGKEREVEVEDGLSVAARAEKVKKTLDEYKALDHEDMIGDLPTRFKYTQTAPVDFGLTPVEILMATDAELNALAGMRHIAPYKRGGGLGRAGQGLPRRIRDLKGQLSRRKWGEEEQPEDEPQPTSSGSGSNADSMGKKRKWGEEGAGGTQGAFNSSEARTGEGAAKKKRMGPKQRAKLKAAQEAAAASGTLAASTVSAVASISTGEHRGGQEVDDREAVEGGEKPGGEGEGKKKRRKKKKSGAVASGEVVG